jgi:glycerol-3-phosphate dehydrogenase subunit C
MDKIREIDPDRVVTDCLSCRLQFNQLLPFPVSHPIEVLRDAFACNGS